MDQYFPLLLLLCVGLVPGYLDTYTTLQRIRYDSAFELKCQSKMTAIRNQSVTLPYYTEPPTSLPTSLLEWVYNGTDDVYAVRGNRVDLNHQKAEVKGKASIFHDQLSKGNGSLKLLDPLSGEYCLRLSDTRMCCTNLTVCEPGELEKGIGMPSSEPWIIVGGIVIVGVIVALIIGIVFKKRKKKKANCPSMPEPTVCSRTDGSSTPHSTLLTSDAVQTQGSNSRHDSVGYSVL